MSSSPSPPPMPRKSASSRAGRRSCAAAVFGWPSLTGICSAPSSRVSSSLSRQRRAGHPGGERRERGTAARPAARRAGFDSRHCKQFAHDAFRLRRVRGTITLAGRTSLPQASLGQPRRRNLAKVSHRLLRGILMPFTSGLAAALTVLGVIGSRPPAAAPPRARRAPIRPRPGMVAGRPARDPGLADLRGSGDHRRRPRHGRRLGATRTWPAT